MKKVKIFCVLVGCLLLLLVFVYARPLSIYFTHSSISKPYFGESYNELLHPTSVAGYIHGNTIISQAEEAFSALTPRQDAYAAFGTLGKYCIHTDSYPNAVMEEHKLRLVAADITQNGGYVWVLYTSRAFDDDGKLATASSDVLARWGVEKQGNNWVVTSIKEQP